MYKELKQAAKHYKGETNYCSVIALAVAAGCKFGKARAALARQGRVTGRGTYRDQQIAAAAELGFRLVYEHELGQACKTLKTCTKYLPRKGTYWVYSRGHVTAVRDGVMHDWAAETGSQKRVLDVYRVTKI